MPNTFITTTLMSALSAHVFAYSSTGGLPLLRIPRVGRVSPSSIRVCQAGQSVLSTTGRRAFASFILSPSSALLRAYMWLFLFLLVCFCQTGPSTQNDRTRILLVVSRYSPKWGLTTSAPLGYYSLNSYCPFNRDIDWNSPTLSILFLFSCLVSRSFSGDRCPGLHLAFGFCTTSTLAYPRG
jgi:hypothetical protein